MTPESHKKLVKPATDQDTRLKKSHLVPVLVSQSAEIVGHNRQVLIVSPNELDQEASTSLFDYEQKMNT